MKKYTLIKKIRYFFYKYLINDRKAIDYQFKKRLGRLPNLGSPKLFTDKLQWLKLNWNDDLAVKMADKYEVREIVAEIIGEQYLNELYAVYDSVDEIRINDLPNSFVLKGTHGSGYNLIVKDKNCLNWEKESKDISGWLKENYFWLKREWVYKDIKPRIVCERYLEDKEDSSTSLSDYKFYCFNGKPYYCQIIRDRGENETIDFFDMDWNHMPFVGMRLLPNSSEELVKPEKFDEMKEIATALSKGFPFVRVDLYYVNNQIYFGEMTFFPTSGMGQFDPPEWDRKLGELLKLPTRKNG